MKRLKLSSVVVATGLLVAVIGIAACGGEKKASFDLTIGNLVPETGDLSVFGPPGTKAADLAAKEAEKAIKAAGVDITVKVDTGDTETKPQASVSAARKLVSGGATCVAGAWASADTIPVAESVAIKQKVPLVSPASTSAEITDLKDDGYIFRTAPSDNLQAVALADVVEEELGGTGKTLSLAARNDAYGEGFIDKFKEAWEERGGKVLGPVKYDPEQANYNSEAGKIVKGDPDGFVIIDFPETYAKVGAALVRTGKFDAKKLFVADGLAADKIPEGIPSEALDGATGSRPGTPEAGAAAKAFDKLYKAAPGAKRQTFDAQNFDATLLCFLAAVAAGSNDATEIRDEMKNVSGPPGDKYTFEKLGDAVKALNDGNDIDYEGASGPINLDDNGDPGSATYEVWNYKNGKLVVDRQILAGSSGEGSKS